MNRKVIYLKQTVFLAEYLKCFAVSKATTRVRMLSFDIDTQPTVVLPPFIVLSMMRCSKSSQKSAVEMCQFAAVVMKTNLKTFCHCQWTIE